MAGFFERNEDLTSANTKPVTLKVLQELLDLATSSLVERLERLFDKAFTQICNKVTMEDTVSVSQSLNNTELLNGEVKVEGTTQLKALVEKGMEGFQIEKERLRGLKDYKQEILRKIPPETLIQLIGKLSGTAGVFNIRRKTRNGTSQFLYRKGLFNLIKEVCLLCREQDCKLQQLQLKIREFVQVKEGGGIRVKKKVRKKARKKWRWENYNPPCRGG